MTRTVPTRPATLADDAENGFRLVPICRRCWHSGPPLEPAEIAARYDVPMATPILDLARRLKCSQCGERAGYFGIDNPNVHPVSAV